MPDGVEQESSPRTLLLITPCAARHTNDSHVVDGLSSQGWRVSVVSPHRWPHWLRRTAWPVAFSLLATARALRSARRERPDVILGHTPMASIAVFVVSIVCGVPSAIKLFHSPSTGRFWLSARIPHDLWIVVDDGTGGDAALRRHGVPSEKIRLIPRGVDLSLASRAGDGDAFRRAHDIPTGARVLLWHSQLVEGARADHALDAFVQARDRSTTPLHLIIAGDGPEGERLRARVQGSNVAAAVHMVAELAHDAVPDIMAAASVFLATHPRSNKSAGVCDAMLCGVPVVAYDAGGSGDVVRDGETGRLIADGDVDGLADALAGLLNDGPHRASLGAAARAFALARFVGRERQLEMERELLERIVIANQR